MNTTFIYALCEPDTGEIRYIGKSDHPIKRLQDHLAKSRHNTHRVCWIKGLKNRGMVPTLKILDEVPIIFWPQLEVAYIEFYKEQGCDLVNGTLGGDGLRATEEIKEKLSKAKSGPKHHFFGKKFSPEHREKIAAAHRGEKHHYFGVKRTPEERLKQSQNLSEEARKKLSNDRLGEKGPRFGTTQSPETRRKMTEAQKLRWERRRQEQVLSEMWR